MSSRSNTPQSLRPPALSAPSSRPPRLWRWRLVLAIWALPLVLGLLAEVFTNAPATEGWRMRISEATIWMLWALFTPGIMTLTQRFPPFRPQLLRNLVVHGLAAATITVVQSTTLALAEPWARPDSVGTLGERASRSLSGPFVVSVILLYAMVSAAGLGIELRQRYRQARSRSALLERERAALAQQLAETRLEALQRQLQPHFLFNTLHAISAMMESDTNVARRMASRLAGLLRAALAAPLEMALEDELALLEAFLDIERIRFGDRLQVEYQVADAARHLAVPTMILQPLVENAIHHGLESRTRAIHDSPSRSNALGQLSMDESELVGRIQIVARVAGTDLHLSVVDNGPGVDEARRAESGVGLSNTRARLAERYGARASLALISCPDGGVEARLLLPATALPTSPANSQSQDNTEVDRP